MDYELVGMWKTYTTRDFFLFFFLCYILLGLLEQVQAHVFKGNERYLEAGMTNYEFKMHDPLHFGVLGTPASSQSGDLPRGDKLAILTHYGWDYGLHLAYSWKENSIGVDYSSFKRRDTTAFSVAGNNRTIWATSLPGEFNEEEVDFASGDFQYNYKITDCFLSRSLSNYVNSMLGVSFGSFFSYWRIVYAGGNITAAPFLPVNWENRISGTGFLLGMNVNYPVFHQLHAFGLIKGRVMYGHLNTKLFSQDEASDRFIDVKSRVASYLPMITAEMGLFYDWNFLRDHSFNIKFMLAYQFDELFNQQLFLMTSQNRNFGFINKHSVAWSAWVARIIFTV